MLSNSAKVLKSVNIWQSYREFNSGNFFETQCRYDMIVRLLPISQVESNSSQSIRGGPLAIGVFDLPVCKCLAPR